MENSDLNFIKLKLCNERDFICSYFNISKLQIRYMFADLLNKNERDCHIGKLNYTEICKCFEFIRHMTLGARLGEGRRIPKTITNFKQYGNQLRKEQADECL